MRLGELERAVMEVLWRHPDGIAARDLTDALPSRPAITTVLTVLDRLTRKELVTRTKQGRAHRYAAVGSKEAFLASAMHTAMAEADDPGTVLTHFVGSVGTEEAEALREALRRLGRARPHRRDTGKH